MNGRGPTKVGALFFGSHQRTTAPIANQCQSFIARLARFWPSVSRMLRVRKALAGEARAN